MVSDTNDYRSGKEDIDSTPGSIPSISLKAYDELHGRLSKLAEKLNLSNENEDRFISSLLKRNCSRKVFAIPSGTEFLKDKIKLLPEQIIENKNSRAKPKLVKLCKIPWVDDKYIKEENDITSDQLSINSYPLDLSSVFMGSPLLYIRDIIGKEKDSPTNSLDACASPGGKSVLLYCYLKPLFHIANEKNPKRIKALVSNFSRLNLKNACVTNNDARSIFHKMDGSFSLILLDAPCSGQALIGKGLANSSSLTPIAANSAASIQRSLLHKSANSVSPGGYLLYMTCTFSREENEKVIHSFLNTQKDFSAVEVPMLKEHQSHLADFSCYRLWPYEGLGAGGFTCLLQKNGLLKENSIKTPIPAKICWSSL
ncbi:MAG TPA: hypothetical protein PKA63_08675 [Oligoflexia bacterium]|nr:hypothetical protein [Oligoflexia bacterium]HMP48725.1 hypothetical protein [Oligoflexia bacterium]